MDCGTYGVPSCVLQRLTGLIPTGLIPCRHAVACRLQTSASRAGQPRCGASCGAGQSHQGGPTAAGKGALLPARAFMALIYACSWSRLLVTLHQAAASCPRPIVTLESLEANSLQSSYPLPTHRAPPSRRPPAPQRPRPHAQRHHHPFRSTRSRRSPPACPSLPGPRTGCPLPPGSTNCTRWSGGGTP